MKLSALRLDARIALIYATFGGVWVLFSDRLVLELFPDLSTLTLIQAYKSWVFIALSTLILFLLLKHELHLAHITERRLHEANEQYQQLFEHSLDAILLAAPDGSVFAANPTACEMFGRSEEEIIQVGRNGLVDAADIRVKKALEERARTGKFRRELTLLRKDGTKFEAEVSNRLHKNSIGLERTSMIIRDISERKRAEEAQRKNQLMFSVIFEKAPFSASLASLPEGRIEKINEEFEKLFGFSRQEAIGKTSLELGLYPDPETRKLSAAKFQEQGFVRNMEFNLQTKSGEVRNLSVNTDIVDIEGVKYILSTAQDITEHKRSEEKMRESEARFSTIFHASPIGINLFRISDGCSVNANAAFLDLIGYEREELIGHSAAELDLFVDTAARKAWMEELRSTGKVRGVDAQLRRKSGEIRHALASIDIIDIGSERMGLVIAVDITDRKRAEHALKKNEQILRLFVEHTPASVAMFDRNMKYIVASNRYLADYELGNQNLVGRSHYEVFPEIPEHWMEIHRHCLAGAVERSEEDPFLRKNGQMDWVRWEIRPWYEHEGEIGGIILFSEVITERKLAQEEIRQHRDQLMELSLRLAETRENEARAIGRELHDQIGQMLTAIKITLDLAAQVPAESKAKKIQQAQTIITELLERVSLLSLQLRPPMLDDLGLIPALAWHINRWQEQSGIEVDFKHNNVEGKRFASEIETAAYRLVQESLTNVARHAQATRVRIEIQNSGEELGIQIADNGIGFDPQAALAKNRGLGGMRERAQLIGGTFHVESEQGNTRKTIRLPLKEHV